MVERDPGQEESPAQETSRRHHPQVRPPAPCDDVTSPSVTSLSPSPSLRRFVKGFIHRHRERCPENEYFLDYVRYSFLMNLRRNLPKNVLDKSWPTPPAALSEVRGRPHARTHARTP